MDVCFVIKKRLQELGLEQKDLAAAAEVTESYISQLLNRKKLPPAPDRTDIYEKMGRFLQLSNGELATLARAQRMDELRRDYEEPQGALLKETRELILEKCVPARQREIRAIFERQPFGELERLVTRTLLDVISRVARAELDNEAWLHQVAELSDKSYAQMRVIILEFLDTDIFNLSNADCVSFLNPLLARWDIDLATFDMEIVLNERLVPGAPKRFAFVEREVDSGDGDEPGFAEFLEDATLSGDASAEEIEFLRKLRFKGKHPGALYYYRELQNLRDPLHFPPA
ncbi:MAG: helix-turn-helix transcriptional regulator [Woeseiaceae bacterium]|jgi:transcriptional regulator with XRE-family HTH domain|nr:helix-turn-helix transcriptional regulator [Woeseiaceae bacterium]